MPARGAPKPDRPPPEKEVWTQAFEAELVKLRPHLGTYGGKVVTTIALQAWVKRTTETPEAAARAWDKANPTPTS